jgi:hypothetical protein
MNFFCGAGASGVTHRGACGGDTVDLYFEPPFVFPTNRPVTAINEVNKKVRTSEELSGFLVGAG